MLLLDHILNKKLSKPFIKIPPEGSLPVLALAETKAQLSDKFKKMFMKIDSDNLVEKLVEEDKY